MSIRFQADNDLKRIIVDATLRREPRIDFQTAKQLVWTISMMKRLAAFSWATTSGQWRKRVLASFRGESLVVRKMLHSSDARPASEK